LLDYELETPAKAGDVVRYTAIKGELYGNLLDAAGRKTPVSLYGRLALLRE
jgi:hypothetical protein